MKGLCFHKQRVWILGVKQENNERDDSVDPPNLSLWTTTPDGSLTLTSQVGYPPPVTSKIQDFVGFADELFTFTDNGMFIFNITFRRWYRHNVNNIRPPQIIRNSVARWYNKLVCHHDNATYMWDPQLNYWIPLPGLFHTLLLFSIS